MPGEYQIPTGLAPLAQLFEQYAVAFISTASGLYILRCLPSALFPQGALLTTTILLVGVALGVAGVVGTVVYLFLLLTRPGSTAASAVEPAGQHAHSHRRRAPGRPGGGVTAAGDVPPHAFSKQGELSGVVYTIPLSRLEPDAVIPAWPPATSGPDALAKKWKAVVSQGTLVLTPVVDPQQAQQAQQAQQQQQAGKKQAAARKEASPGEAAGGSEEGGAAEGSVAASSTGEGGSGEAPPPAVPAKVGIPLENCTVEVMESGLGGRSRWLRRAPLLVCHPQWNLLDGERGFYMLAEDPASKQQWYHALSWWCGGAQRGRQLEELYAAFCASMRARSALEYPQEAIGGGGEQGAGDNGGTSGADNGDSGSNNSSAAGQQQGAPGGRRGWKWAPQKMVQGMKKRVQERRRGGREGELSEPATPQAALGAAAAAAAEVPGPPEQKPHPHHNLEDAIESLFDAKWMQSSKAPVPPSIPQAVAVARSPSPARKPPPPRRAMSADGEAVAKAGGPSTPLLGSSPAAGGLAATLAAAAAAAAPAASPQPSPSKLQRPSSLPGTPLRGAAAAAATEAATLGQSPVPLGSTPSAPAGKPALGALPPLPQQRSGELGGAEEGPPASPAATPGAAAAGAGAGAPPRSAAGPAPGVGVPPGMPPLLAADYALNMFLTRAGFDLLRNPAVKERVKERIQRRLSFLNTPDYVQSLEVSDVSLGSTVPTVRNFAALPTPDDAIWPQAVFDFYYTGTFTITLETKVDIRDAAAWGRFDRALSRLEGRGGGRLAAGGGPAAASSPELGGLGGVGSPRASEAGDDDGADPGLLSGNESEEQGSLLQVERSSASDPTGAGSLGAGEGAAGAAGGGAAGKGGKKEKGQLMNKIRATAGRTIRQLAETTATRISRMPLRLSLTFSVLEGTMVAWVPPPPGNRLFISFLRPPRLVVTAKPELAGRLLKYSYHIARVSSWIEQRMRAALTKNMVFPGCSDLVLEGLMDLDNPHVADPLQGFLHSQQQQQQAPSKRQQAAGSGSSGMGGPHLSRSAPQLSRPSPAAGEREEWEGSVSGASQPASPLGLQPSAPVPVPPRSALAAAQQQAQQEEENGEGEGEALGSAHSPASWPQRFGVLRGQAPASALAGARSLGREGSALAPLGASPSSSSASSRRVSKSVSFKEDSVAGGEGQVPAAAEASGGSGSALPAPTAARVAGSSVGSSAEGAGGGQPPRVGSSPAALGLGSPAADAALAASPPPFLDAQAAFGSCFMGGADSGDQEARTPLSTHQQPSASSAANGSFEGQAAASLLGTSGNGAQGGQAGSEGAAAGEPAVETAGGVGGQEEESALLPPPVARTGSAGHLVGMAGGAVEGRSPARLQTPFAQGEAGVGSPVSPHTSSRLMSRGLQYLRRQSQQGPQQAQQAQPAPSPSASRELGASSPQQAQQRQQAQQAAEQGKPGFKAQGRRMAGLVLSRMNQAGKALAQHMQQQQHQQQHQQRPQEEGQQG